MKRTPIKRSDKPMKRTPLRQVSKHRAAVNRERIKLQEAAWGPKRWWRCVFRDNPAWLAVAGPCHGPVHGHETLSRARAGQTDANLLDISGQVPCCNYHNEWCESHPEEAHRFGLTRHAWDEVKLYDRREQA